ncbi:MAG: hypothetical protein OXK73_02770 [Rhodospirillaceae bacterium]|nr:hypothetical protein [Rhodospirillaceae bacterium]MDE0360238.1 hypothetical protein [Rhodospirillaceae bacterium]
MDDWMIGVAAGGGLTIVITATAAVFKFGKWVGAVNTDRDAFKEFMKEVRGALAEIFRRLPTPPATVSASPIQLSDFGREISATGDASAWAGGHAPDLEAEAAGKEEFEVFDLCVAYVEKVFAEDEEFQRRVRATAYQHGTEVAQVLRVYQVELRDRLRPPSQ